MPDRASATGGVTRLGPSKATDRRRSQEVPLDPAIGVAVMPKTDMCVVATHSSLIRTNDEGLSGAHTSTRFCLRRRMKPMCGFASVLGESVARTVDTPSMRTGARRLCADRLPFR